MKKTITVDTLNLKSIYKARTALEKIAYNFNFKQVAKVKLIDLNVDGSKILSVKHNINTLGDVAKLNIVQLKALKGVGPKTVLSVRDAMHGSNVSFKTIPKVKTIKAKAKVTK